MYKIIATHRVTREVKIFGPYKEKDAEVLHGVWTGFGQHVWKYEIIKMEEEVKTTKHIF